MSIKTFTRSFAGGEVSPLLYGRLDLVKYQTGLAVCRNFRILPQGPAENRPGFEFVRACKYSDLPAVLIPFSYNSEQSFALEFGNGYIRFHTQGATLLSGGVPYEIASPYSSADLFDLHYVQSADVLTIVHQNYAPRELRRLAATNWTLTAPSFVPTVTPPDAPVLSTYGPGGGNPKLHTYVTTAIAPTTFEESLASAPTSASWDLTVAGNSVNVTADTVYYGGGPPPLRFNVYKEVGGVYGYIGQVLEATGLPDANIQPDMSKTPPLASNPFATAYPRAVSYFEQRRCFGGSGSLPQSVWMTRSGTETNMTYSMPAQNDDAITARIVAREAQTVRHFVPLGDLLALTSGGVWRIAPSGGDVLAPSTFSARPQSYVGASNAQPVVTNRSVLYVADRGAHVHEVSYKWETQAYQSDDVSVLAPHLFDYQGIRQLAYGKAPVQMLWAVRSDGVLLGMTHTPEHEVTAWHRHETQGQFESVCAVAEGTEDGVYVVVSRSVNGATVRYVERMHTRQFTDLADAFFVDSGLTYSGAPATVISGLGHLEGKTVAILADGGVEPAQVVAGGQITLEEPASKVHVGLPYDCDLQSLPLASEALQAYGQCVVKNINEVKLRVLQASGIKAGPSFDRLKEYSQRTDEPMGTAPAAVNGVIGFKVEPKWQQEGAVCIRQSNPLPLTVVTMSFEVEVGG